MRQNKHSRLALQSVISNCLFGIRGKSLLELFCHHENPIDRIGQVTRTTQLDKRKVLVTWPKTLNLKPNPKPEPKTDTQNRNPKPKTKIEAQNLNPNLNLKAERKT